jgi:predicted ATP-grasp superfamily ATP-dependent carboligase
LIVGASTRAAAFSALRAGLAPRCSDFFADRDLSSTCPVARVDSQEGAEGFERGARELSGDAWIFTGPLENLPHLVERLSRTIPLLGTGPAALRAVRDPLRVSEVLRATGLDAPDVRLSPEGLPRDGTWMVKPVASGGGRLVQILVETWRPCTEPCYFQKRLRAPSYSALFIADRGAADLIGVTKQLVGSPGSPFGYRGSVGPWQPSDGLTCRLRAIGQTLSTSFALAGWFGVDFILHDGRPWPVEVNPRYVASTEVLELATGRSLVAEHLRACGEGFAASRPPLRPPDDVNALVVGKAILYARRTFLVPDVPVPDLSCRTPFAIPEIADVPWPGTRIEAGQPVLTVFASGEDIATCETRLRFKEERWRGLLRA